jgi:5-deoxy-5-amino-3-dehydroquinate synthase
VAVGLVFAARLARRLGRVDDERVGEHQAVVGGYDLPRALPVGADVAELVEVMGRDKKAVAGSDGCLTFVLDGARGLEVVDKVSADVVAAVLDEEMRP